MVFPQAMIRASTNPSCSSLLYLSNAGTAIDVAGKELVL